MNLTLLFTFWGVVFLLIVVPGPDWAFTVASGLHDRSVMPAVGGIVLGYLLLTGIVAVGVGAVVSHYPMVLTVITVVGAGYLAYLGVATLARPGVLRMPTSVPPDAEPAQSPAWLRVVRGVGVSGLNPKGLLLFGALLPQFIDRDAGWPFAAQVVALGLLFAGTCAIVYLALGVSASAILRTRPGISRWVSRVSGAAMIAIGLFLVVERITQPGAGIV